MNIFIDTISIPGNIILFDDSREMIFQESVEIKGNESSGLIPKIDEILKKNNYTYHDIKNIVVVNGPGSFTGVRTTVLVANSINYIIGKDMTSISYFDMFQEYPIFKSSSKRDCFLKKSQDSQIEVVSNEDCIQFLKETNITTLYGECNPDIYTGVKILDKVDYIRIIRELKYTNVKKIEPLYIKKPNIT